MPGACGDCLRSGMWEWERRGPLFLTSPVIQSLKSICAYHLFFVFVFLKYLFIYLAALGLSCGTQDLVP